MRDRHEARGIVLCLDPLEELAQHLGNALGLHALQVRPDRLQVVLAEVISRMEPSGGRACGGLVSLGDPPGVHY
jgi:hypothetical protein